MGLSRDRLILFASIGFVVAAPIAFAARDIASATSSKTNMSASAHAVAGSSKGHVPVPLPAGNGEIPSFVVASGSPLDEAIDTVIFNGSTRRPLFIRHVSDGTFASMTSAIITIRGVGRDAEPLTIYARNQTLRSTQFDLSDKPGAAALARTAAAAFARDGLDQSAAPDSSAINTANIWGIDDSPILGPSAIVLIRITEYGYVARYGERLVHPPTRPSFVSLALVDRTTQLVLATQGVQE